MRLRPARGRGAPGSTVGEGPGREGPPGRAPSRPLPLRSRRPLAGSAIAVLWSRPPRTSKDAKESRGGEPGQVKTASTVSPAETRKRPGE